MPDVNVPGGWEGNRRRDGFEVVERHMRWIVVTPDHRPDLRSCPCCDKLLLSARAAMLVCNAIYPPPGEA